jgi:hypothetical protein
MSSAWRLHNIARLLYTPCWHALNLTRSVGEGHKARLRSRFRLLDRDRIHLGSFQVKLGTVVQTLAANTAIRLTDTALEFPNAAIERHHVN